MDPPRRPLARLMRLTMDHRGWHIARRQRHALLSELRQFHRRRGGVHRRGRCSMTAAYMIYDKYAHTLSARAYANCHAAIASISTQRAWPCAWPWTNWPSPPRPPSTRASPQLSRMPSSKRCAAWKPGSLRPGRPSMVAPRSTALSTRYRHSTSATHTKPTKNRRANTAARPADADNAALIRRNKDLGDDQAGTPGRQLSAFSGIQTQSCSGRSERLRRTWSAPPPSAPPSPITPTAQPSASNRRTPNQQSAISNHPSTIPYGQTQTS